MSACTHSWCSNVDPVILQEPLPSDAPHTEPSGVAATEPKTEVIPAGSLSLQQGPSALRPCEKPLDPATHKARGYPRLYRRCALTAGQRRPFRADLCADRAEQSAVQGATHPRPDRSNYIREISGRSAAAGKSDVLGCRRRLAQISPLLNPHQIAFAIHRHRVECPLRKSAHRASHTWPACSSSI